VLPLISISKPLPMDAQLSILAVVKLISQLAKEEERYIAAMQSNKLFWELKIIYNRIKMLKTELEKISIDSFNELYG
jgi:hypothetical protein